MEPNQPTNSQRRKSLRQTSTKPEQLIWSVLQNRKLAGLKFRRQHSIGPWIADFACMEKMVVIEIDGGYHDKTQDKDTERQRYLEAEGFKVLRFQNEEVLTNLEGVSIAIRRLLGLPDEDNPSP
ncbi:hypothetical protein Pan97_33320 [Bremerella volcania]|uniref:DUF559 domain-containing protein n=1 Tax=Bremerella volcania TaxID=2527984 RepID=A0A518CAN1_9BACT|nr:endonuclease domain-containing protein [Bremerella volcania]QDU76285.1 hypothetical protein Pan97_33320 [Bremerella volcania]